CLHSIAAAARTRCRSALARAGDAILPAWTGRRGSAHALAADATVGGVRANLAALAAATALGGGGAGNAGAGGGAATGAIRRVAGAGAASGDADSARAHIADGARVAVGAGRGVVGMDATGAGIAGI